MNQILLAIMLAVLLSLAGCTPEGTRCVTAWGIWAAPMGQPIGVGYWNSAHGDKVNCGQSEGPTLP